MDFRARDTRSGLLASGAFDILWSSHYVRSRFADRLAGSALGKLPLKSGAMEASLWLAPRQR